MSVEQRIRDAITTLQADGFRILRGRFNHGYAEDNRIIVDSRWVGCCPMTAVARVSEEAGNTVIGTASNYLGVSKEWCMGFVSGWDKPNDPKHTKDSRFDYCHGAALGARLSREYIHETNL